jgi:heme/copper-type cytochrome/quinol oxidase subunit 4
MLATTIDTGGTLVTVLVILLIICAAIWILKH